MSKEADGSVTISIRISIKRRSGRTLNIVAAILDDE